MQRRYKILLALAGVIVVGLTGLGLTVSHTADCPPPAAAADGATLMNAVVYRCYGSPDVLSYERVRKPTPGAREILVRVRAAAVNPLDWHYMRGSPYLMRLSSGIGKPVDVRMGTDFAGTVEAVGAGVDGFRVGDRVFGATSGAFGEYVTIPASWAVASIPAHTTFEQAAAIPVAGTTALEALQDHGRLQPGEKVLINGASGGVGSFAVQIAKAMGAEVTAVCSARNVELVRGIGADHVVDYGRENFTESSERYDLIVDNVGNHPLLKLTDVLKPDGRLVIVGGAKGDWIAPLLGPMKAALLSPFVDQTLTSFIAGLSKDRLQELADLMNSGDLRSVIDRRFPLAETAAAVAYSETGRARGKIVIDVL